MDYIKRCEELLEELAKETNFQRHIEIKREICRNLIQYGQEEAFLFDNQFQELNEQYEELIKLKADNQQN